MNIKNNKIKSFFKDSTWCILGLSLMNFVAQIIVYPIWSRYLGTEQYGNIVFLLSLMNIYSISVGVGVNNARMAASAEGKTSNKAYLNILAFSSILAIPLCLIIKLFGKELFSWTEFIFFVLLVIVTIWRFYADIEYRLNLNYKGYFIYYLLVSIGYLLGCPLFIVTKIWPLALLPGEIVSILLIRFKGTIFKKDICEKEEQIKAIKTVAALFFGSVLSSLVFNGDRMLLKFLMDGTAVTIYYLASLFGKTISLISQPFNSVIIGYLAKYNGKFTKKIMNYTTLISLGAIILGTFACSLASHIILPILYPNDFALAKSYIIIATVTQIIYFVSRSITIVLLRFAKAKYQLIVNIYFIVAFAVFCIPLTHFYGITGFCYGMLIATSIYYLICIVIGYKNTIKNKD